MTMDAVTNLVQWTPTSQQMGDSDVAVEVADAAGATTDQSFIITVHSAYTLGDVTDMVTTSFTRARRTASRMTAAFNVLVTNTSGNPLKAPIKLVIYNITGGVTILNRDGIGEAGEPFAGKPYFIMLNTGELEPGYSTATRYIEFSNPNQVRFEFDVSCWAMTKTGSGVPAPSGESCMPVTIPSESAMGQNYPNPFNPETWIPYQLCEDADVAISIYSISGELVRKLELGQKNAGIYISRDEAAYWDGRNSIGEEATSGVYFYSIKAGDFTDTRKLVIVR
jgi:hypothetical protein